MKRRMAIGAALVVGVLLWWAAAPGVSARLEPVSAAQPRRWAGPLPCRADEVLRSATDTEGVLRAARCGESRELADADVLPAFRAARAAVEDLAARGAPAADLVSIAELASDQQRMGPLVQVAAWTAVQASALEVLESRSPEELAPLAPRLAAVAAADLDLAELHAREERAMWAVSRRMVVTPATWPELAMMPLHLWRARTGTHPIEADILEDVSDARARAAALSAVR